MQRAAVIDLRDASFWQDPYPALRLARESGRLAVTPQQEVVVLDADDVDLVQSSAAFGQPGLASLERLGVNDGPFYEWRGLTMAVHDGAVHDRLRGAVSRAFTPRRVERLRDALAQHATTELSRVAAQDVPFDVVSEFSHDLPLWLICEFLGLPQDARIDIDGLLAGTEEIFTDPLTPDVRKRAEDGIVALAAYVEDLVRARKADAREDLVTDLLASEEEGSLGHDELIALVVNVIGGAVGSSRVAISNSVLELLRDPLQAAFARADRTRLAPAVEECLRYHPPFRLGRRRVLEANRLLGVPLGAGDNVVIARQAANRDPQRWTDPHTFDVSRVPTRHYSFGYGAHFCLGQALARLDVQEAVWAFIGVLPAAELLTREPRRTPFTADEQLEQLWVAPRSIEIRQVK